VFAVDVMILKEEFGLAFGTIRFACSSSVITLDFSSGSFDSVNNFKFFRKYDLNKHI
jgi:hypothetical protein